MAATTFDPTRFIPDYSWIGTAGKQIASTVNQFADAKKIENDVLQNKMDNQELFQELKNQSGKLGFDLPVTAAPMRKESNAEYLKRVTALLETKQAEQRQTQIAGIAQEGLQPSPITREPVQPEFTEAEQLGIRVPRLQPSIAAVPPPTQEAFERSVGPELAAAGATVEEQRQVRGLAAGLPSEEDELNNALRRAQIAAQNALTKKRQTGGDENPRRDTLFIAQNTKQSLQKDLRTLQNQEKTLRKALQSDDDLSAQQAIINSDPKLSNDYGSLIAQGQDPTEALNELVTRNLELQSDIQNAPTGIKAQDQIIKNILKEPKTEFQRGTARAVRQLEQVPQIESTLQQMSSDPQAAFVGADRPAVVAGRVNLENPDVVERVRRGETLDQIKAALGITTQQAGTKQIGRFQVRSR